MESMVGRQGVVTGEVDNLQGIGQVTVSGQEWSAVGADDGLRIPVGTVVDVLAVRGVKLVVKVDEQMKRVDPDGLKNQIPEPLSVSQIEEMESENKTGGSAAPEK